ncbi:hypothetical protein pEaSNUABM50_00085 [Erwinia phage pEa_SNUABM_50]|uniref:Uncharacterized protein n=3 Tax=Eneladusvirus BF TaxID=2560751 RepID=A0A7L8ZQ14_9CAUD|nr:hypothetical protein FDH34_gp087 [Serratia phage BF]AQW88612.1 hypothetical protein BF_0087 [Serratia phage BF]QOI71025.1 hypothetical protein pEaSNUABM12_00087 [Erwinia phage pEa_SNUABM_12]QOI72109.1 hypothetical protein pEaSNUABM50_00085 [Erwinia phage pEa_SNUABM_50]QXO11782.1 hypothetical protein pEaSNUABM44_00086 [Erwinia phage pEa_SNUABM_44]
MTVMKMNKEKVGIEFTLLNSWEGWDEHGVADLYFYDVKLKPEVFGEDFLKQYEGKKMDLGMYLSISVIEVYVEGEDEPVLIKDVKLSLI